MPATATATTSRTFSRSMSFRATNCAFCARAQGATCGRAAQVLAGGAEDDPVPTCAGYVSRARLEGAQVQGGLFDLAAETCGQAKLAF